MAKFALFAADKPPENLQAEWAIVEKLVDQLKAADTIVLGVSLWNNGINFMLKKYLDFIVQPKLTFDVGKLMSGQPAGLVTGKPCYIFASAGGPSLGSPNDFVTKYLNMILPFIGITDLRWTCINGTADQAGLPELLKAKVEESLKLLDLGPS